MRLKLLLTTSISVFTMMTVFSQTVSHYTNLKINASKFLIVDSMYKDPDILKSKLIQEIIAKLANKDQKDLFTTYQKDLKNRAIILFKFSTNDKDDANGVPNTEDPTKLISTIIHEENGTNSQYLLNIKHILVVFISQGNRFKDATVNIEKQKGRFATTLTDMIELIKFDDDKAKDKAEESLDIYLRYIELTPKELKAPSKITPVYVNSSKDFSIVNHEKSYWSFQAGIQATNINKNAFSISGGKVTISPNDDQKKQWKSNLLAMIVFNPWGQDYDRMSSILTRTKEHNGFIDYFGQRFGIFAGVKIDKDPIQTISTGINFAFFKEVYLNVGCSFVNELNQNRTYDVGNISSLSGLDDYFSRSYKPKLFVGLSFSPGQMLSYLKSK